MIDKFVWLFVVCVLLSIESGYAQSTKNSSRQPPAASQTEKTNATEMTRVAVKIDDFEFKDDARDRIVKIRVYHDGQKLRQPVVLFSHGLGGSRENNPYLGKHWASHGYVAVFMQHTGSDIEVIANVPRLQMFRTLKKAASYESANHRVQDVTFVLDELTRINKATDHKLHGRLDMEWVGLSGHSFGAVTTMTMSGRKQPFRQPSVDEPRIDAFLAMSPQTGKGITPESAFGSIRRPVFCMTGTLDGSPINPSVTGETRQRVYNALPAGNKFHLVLEGAEHHAFGDNNRRYRKLERDPAHHAIIQKLSLEFWDAYLKQDADAKKWLQSKQPTKIIGFKTTDIFAWK